MNQPAAQLARPARRLLVASAAKSSWPTASGPISHFQSQFRRFISAPSTTIAPPNTTAPPSSLVFNKELRLKFLDRSSTNKDAHVYDYVKDFAAKELCDRIDDLTFSEKRTVFNLGSCSGLVAKNLNPERVQLLVQGDPSREALRRAKRSISMLPPSFPVQYVRCDEEQLPIRADSFDLVTSCFDLHWVNDLMGCFRQVYGALRDNCPFVGALPGGDTLFELRSSLQLAELERLSGVSSHVAPKTTGQDVARLLQASGFQLITVDISELQIRYPSMFELMFDLQGMGESNSTLIGSRHVHREVLQAAAAVYQTLYGATGEGGAGGERGVPATFQMIHFIGWKQPTIHKAGDDESLPSRGPRPSKRP